MTHRENAEVIVVCAGWSGLPAAKLPSEAGIKTIVLEKRAKDSTKNCSSEIVCQESFENAFGSGSLLNEKNGKISAPIERFLSEYRTYQIQKDSFTSINFRNQNSNNFIVLRRSFNQWMSEAVENKGAFIAYQEVARELIIKDRKIYGVKTDNNEYFANVVIVAEGINSTLTKKTGLRIGEFTPNQVFLFLEENISLPSELIEERFNLEKDQGIAAQLLTNSFFDTPSIGYLYTNKESITIGTGVLLSSSIEKETNINKYLEKIKNHPAIKPLLHCGIINNFNSYILPTNKGDLNGILLPKLFTNGCLIVGGAALLANPYSFDPSALVILSGKFAADTIIKAKNLNDYSEKTLSHYGKAIKQHLNQEKRNYGNSIPNDQKIINNLRSLISQGK